MNGARPTRLVTVRAVDADCAVDAVADLVVTADCAVDALAAVLAPLLGQPADPEWGLAHEDGRPLEPTATLAEGGVLDGDRLLLFRPGSGAPTRRSESVSGRPASTRQARFTGAERGASRARS